MERRCDKCEFWEVAYEYRDGRASEFEHPDDFIGVCRRYPPVIDITKLDPEDEFGAGAESNQVMWKQPLTSGCDWCGEFIEAPATATPSADPSGLAD